jgi:hypothetical protein
MFTLISALPQCDELVNKIRPFIEDYLIDKSHDTKVAYLWRPCKREPQDDMDKKFINSFVEGNDQLLKVELYGYHTYGGFPVFFRPDLDEISRLIGQECLVNDTLRAAPVYFVNTQPSDIRGNPTITIRDCYDNLLDRHRAKTTVYY